MALVGLLEELPFICPVVVAVGSTVMIVIKLCKDLPQAADDEVGNTVGKGIRLTGPGAGYNQQGSSDMTVGGDAVLDGSTLLWIERFEI